MTPTQQRVLLIGPNRVGDLVMATPAFRALRERLPDAHLTLMTRPFLLDLVRPSPRFDAFLPGCGHHDGLLAMLGTTVRIRRGHFDLAVLFPNSFRSALLARLGGCKRALGYDRDGRGWLLTDRALPVTADGCFVPVPTIGYYLDLADRLGARTDDRSMELFVDDADRERAEAVLTRAGLTHRGPLVLLSPGASFGPSKCWPAERFARAADLLAEKIDAAVAVICAPDEVEQARLIPQSAKHDVVILGEGRLPLGVLKGVVERADLVITNDTGTRHIAAALGRSVLTLFGPTDPTWAQIDYDKECIVRIDVPCGPCQLPECPEDHRCMRGIEPERVVAEALELLNRFAGRTADGCG